ncbi:MAG: energy-coupling factor transport system ATP-binding protein [Sphingomonadales bacterium]|jgi:energy-coupling factor transport system ATP-binding protein|nr:energy-coupling factor transport system ATP-binding protein [Sphingomonadales bacterium]
MSITYHLGPNLSGRSEALRNVAWPNASRPDGIYLHPNPVVNFSGFARTVAGETFLHNMAPAQQASTNSTDVNPVSDLAPSQSLLTLSGGQQVRLVLACALRSSRPILCVDGLLEQLDPLARGAAISMLSELPREIHIADNYGGLVARAAARDRLHHRKPGIPDLNAGLADVARTLRGVRVNAPDLELRNIGFRYKGGATVFTDTSFVLRAGRTYLLQAPNGSGKSTLARLLVGVLRPNAGEILVAGCRHAPHRSELNLIFYGFQNHQDQLFGRTASEYLEKVAARAAIRPTFLEGSVGLDVAALIGASRLDHFRDVEPFELPSFVGKRLSVIAALASRSPWLFFDEPSIGSDTEGRSALGDLFHRLAEAGFGVVLVSHGSEFDNIPGIQRITIRESSLVLEGV